jgi:hypothetical protein
MRRRLEVEKGSYDETVWIVGKSYQVDIDCVHCGHPRRIILNSLKWRDEAA